MKVFFLILMILNLVCLFIGAEKADEMYMANGFVAVLLSQLILFYKD